MVKFTRRKRGELMATINAKIHVSREDIQFGIYRNIFYLPHHTRTRALRLALETLIYFGSGHDHDEVDEESERWIKAGEVVDHLFPELRK